MRSWLLLVVSLVLGTAACGADASDDDGGGGDDGVVVGSGDPLEGLPTGADQWAHVCAKQQGDMISQKFCAGSTPPKITSLKELQALLGLGVVPNPNNDPNINKNVRVTFTGHSTGIGLRHVTPLNPRAFLATPALQSGPNPQYQVMAFARGEPFVELVANDPQAQTLRFFLVRFHPACESAPEGCTPAEMLTPAVESGWTGYTLYDDDSIENTTLSCMSCHQAGGPGTRKILRMQEIANPWAHWFYIERQANHNTMIDFHTAHGTEDYAGIPSSLVDPSRPLALQKLLENNGFMQQPNAFDSLKIQTELMTGPSATWNSLYANAVAGTEIAVPYHGIPQTDATKTAAMIQAYQQTMAGSMPRAQMPDISDIFRDDALADMSIRPKPGLDGRGILKHMCTTCHNSKLDQTLSRARFNVETLDQMSREVRDEAIKRLRLPDDDRKKMPPTRFHTLSDAERELVIGELSK